MSENEYMVQLSKLMGSTEGMAAPSTPGGDAEIIGATPITVSAQGRYSDGFPRRLPGNRDDCSYFVIGRKRPGGEIFRPVIRG